MFMSASLCMWLNFAGFAVAFAGWVILGPSARVIAAELGVSVGLVPLLKAAPILVGSAMRVPVGMASDRLGARVVFSACMVIGGLGLLGISQATSATAIICFALVGGMLGTTFVVGVQAISTTVPSNKQGYALGIFGAGNVGTVASTAGFPFVASTLGWRSSFLVYGLGMIVAGILYYLVARDSDVSQKKRRFFDIVKPLALPRVWLFGLFYMASFGVFVAATLILNDFYADVYSLSSGVAALLAAVFCLVTGVMRIPGGIYADKWGGGLVLKFSLAIACISLCPSISYTTIECDGCLYVYFERRFGWSHVGNL